MLGTYGDPRGLIFSYERGTPVFMCGERFLPGRLGGPARAARCFLLGTSFTTHMLAASFNAQMLFSSDIKPMV
jgi:hypothetical protein